MLALRHARKRLLVQARAIAVTQPATQADTANQVIRPRRPERPKPGDSMQVKYHNTDTVDGLYEKCRKPLDRFDPTKRAWHYMVVGMTAGIGITGGRMFVYRFVQFWSAGRDVQASGVTEADLTKVPLGKGATFKWRGSPVFCLHRNDKQIESARSVEASTLRDPQTDEERVQKDNWLICMGVCTHFGCVPIIGAGDFGGFFCPCHGSHYDTSGRIRKGPAPSNLPIPKYKFDGEDTLLIGA